MCCTLSSLLALWFAFGFEENPFDDEGTNQLMSWLVPSGEGGQRLKNTLFKRHPCVKKAPPRSFPRRSALIHLFGFFKERAETASERVRRTFFSSFFLLPYFLFTTTTSAAARASERVSWRALPHPPQ